MFRLHSIRDGFNAFVAAGLVIATIVSLGASWKILAIFAGLGALAFLGMWLRSWLISATLTGIVISPLLTAVNGDAERDLFHAIAGALVGLIVGGILTVITTTKGEC
jgi:hypothetical protein